MERQDNTNDSQQQAAVQEQPNKTNNKKPKPDKSLEDKAKEEEWKRKIANKKQEEEKQQALLAAALQKTAESAQLAPEEKKALDLHLKEQKKLERKQKTEQSKKIFKEQQQQQHQQTEQLKQEAAVQNQGNGESSVQTQPEESKQEEQKQNLVEKVQYIDQNQSNIITECETDVTDAETKQIEKKLRFSDQQEDSDQKQNGNAAVKKRGILLQQKKQWPNQTREGMGGGAQGPSSAQRFVDHLRQNIALERKDSRIQNDKPLHPAMSELALKFSHDKIIGSTARCIAFLEALQHVAIELRIDKNQNFARVFYTHLDEILQQIEAYRSVTEGMLTAYKFSRHVISLLFTLENISERTQREWFCEQIDSFIRQKIVQAHELIIERGLSYIKNDDFIMVFARSKVVESLIIKAHEQGKRFTVIVVDNAPFHEGKELLKSLTQHGLDCVYTLLSHTAYFIKKVTRIFVGASAMLSNGCLVSRIGTSLLACIARDYHKPFHVFCESYKFSEKSQLDSLSWNELANNIGRDGFTSTLRTGGGDKLHKEGSALISSFKENTNIINLRYDLTPCENISMVVTELGPLPPTSVPHVIREVNKQQYIGRIDLPRE